MSHFDSEDSALASMLKCMLPSSCTSSIATKLEVVDQLFPNELSFVSQAVPKRVREFAGGRYCARTALSELGVSPVPILVGSKREPLWPKGIVGSITHCEGCCAAAVARSNELLSLGIDVEPNSPLPAGILETIASPWESRHISRLPSQLNWDRLLFSAKESLYKAWYPMTGLWLDFLHVQLEFDLGNESFHIEFQSTSPQTRFKTNAIWRGRYGITDSFLFTCVTVDEAVS